MSYHIEEEFKMTRERVRRIIATAFDDGTHFARNGDVTRDDVREEAERYAKDFVCGLEENRHE